LHVPAHPEAAGYMQTKRDRMGHLSPHADDASIHPLPSSVIQEQQ
jgi:hypothetical protein